MVSTWLIALLAVLIGGALWMLFPKKNLERRLSESGDDSELSLNYLTNLLKSDPDNEHLKALLQAKRQRYETLKLAEEEARKQALPSAAAQAWDAWQALYQQYLEDKNQGHRAGAKAGQLMPDVLAALKAVPLQELSKEQLLYLASSALVLGDTPGAEAIYEAAVRKQDEAQKAGVYEAAARQMLGLSMYEESARLMLKASSVAGNVEQARGYLWQALDVLQAGGQPRQALALAREQQELLGSDPETLRRLIALARAAGDSAEAERYVKQLMKLALLRQSQQAYAQAAAAGQAFDDGAWALRPVLWQQPGWGLVQTAGTSGADRAPGLAFDDKTYQLGYEVFLENRNLEDAWRTAAAAVRQVPQDMAWRERLARVAEWTGRVQQALDNWLAIAQATNREDAWQAVARLAPGMFDDRALTASILHRLSQRPGDYELQLALVQAYERQAEPQKAMDYLQQHADTPEALVLLAQLAERAGKLELALQSWKKVLSDPQQRTPLHVMPASVLAFRLGEKDLGLSWLEDAQTRVPENMEEEADYWRLLGEVAQQQSRQLVALKAFRRLLDMPDATARDHDEVINLLIHLDKGEAARMSLRAWEHFHDPRHLTQGLYMLQDQGDWSSVGQQVEAVMRDAEHAPLLLEQPAFIQTAAAYYQRAGQGAKAQALLEKGLRLDPDSSLMRQSMLWLLIDTQKGGQLGALMARVEPVWAQDPEMHDALAAAYMGLSRPAVALQRYLRPHLQENRDDFLWMMSYCDALEQNQQVDLAWRLRRELWQKLLARASEASAQQPGAQKTGRQVMTATGLKHWLTPADMEEVQRQARHRLMLTQSHGDDEMALMRELLRTDDAGKELSSAAMELAIAWLQDRGEYSTERGYMWQQYARSRGKRGNQPLWAEITVALAEKDRAEVGQLLQRYDQSLPRYDRVNSASMVDDVRLAQSAGFETQTDQPDDDPLHQALTEQLLAFSHQGGLQLYERRMSGLNEKMAQTRWHWALSPRWSMDFKAYENRRSVHDASMVRAPSSESGIGMTLKRKTQGASSEFMLARHGSLGTYTPIQVSHTQELDNRLSVHGSLGKSLPTFDSLAMRMGGMRNNWTLGANYQLSRLDQLSLEFASDDYRLQTTGRRVGRGEHTTLQYTHVYRNEAPIVQLGAFTSWHRFSRRHPGAFTGSDASILRYLPQGSAPGIDYLLPGRFRFSGLQASINMHYAEEYSRALRPFASLALTHHSVNGAGYDMSLGLSSSVLGSDHLMLSLNFSKSGLNTSGTVREIQLGYRLHF